MKLRLSTINDASLLLEWRNDKKTQQNSFNSEEISLETHLKWFSSSIESPNRDIFIAEENGIPVGTIRVDVISSNYKELSWSIAPSHRGNGYGKLMLNTLVSSYPSVYLAKIKKENSPSIKMVENNDFEFLEEVSGVMSYVRKPTDLEIINAIESVRNTNNVNWMNILRIAFTHAPTETRMVFKKITNSDGEIGNLSKMLADNE